ncbi:MAG: hypothetical protein CBC35_08325 [Planctomycetes bacterium TMED75]|nr:DUF4286 domain-containing protein [Planctomycetaceae bacterium]OUU91996.1 MAG: hypothetical protein CBC35_08325 [Planctomycetes bacterium TMED75]
MSFRYTVQATFEDLEVAREWIDWLVEGHCAEVRKGGASNAQVVRLEGDPITLEVRYDFPDRETFERYEADHAPRLREDGLQRFPVERGIRYRRSCGEVVHFEG